MNTITIVIWSVFQFINIMIEGNGTCSCELLSMCDYVPLHCDFINYWQIFIKNLYEITIRIVRQSILFMNSLKLS